MRLAMKLATTVIMSAIVWGPTAAASAKTASGKAGGASSAVARDRGFAASSTPINVGAIASRLLCNAIEPVLVHAGTGVSIGGRKAPPGDAFYTPPRRLPGCTHGDPVYLRRLDNPAAALVDGTNWLVMYRSEDVHGTPIATSGIIALPKSAPPRGGYPVISWAHGTVGVADTCAPSRDQAGSSAHLMNVYPQALLNQLLRQGWAVAMTDYEGLGTTDRTHPYLLGESEAHGVLDIVRVARHVFGRRISDRFAIVGHSQGGQAALFSAHHAAAWTPELRLAGVAAIAPANHVLGLVQAGAGLTAKLPGFAFTPLFLSGAIAADPTIGPAEVLSDKAYRDNWPQVEQRCRAGLSESDSWGGLQGNEQFKSGYLDAPNDDQERFNQQLREMNPNVTLSVAVRITQAADDERVYANPAPLLGTDALVSELNQTNAPGANAVTYQRFAVGVVPPDPALGIHFGNINHDAPALIDWLRQRLGRVDSRRRAWQRAGRHQRSEPLRHVESRSEVRRQRRRRGRTRIALPIAATTTTINSERDHAAVEKSLAPGVAACPAQRSGRVRKRLTTCSSDRRSRESGRALVSSGILGRDEVAPPTECSPASKEQPHRLPS